MSDDQAHYGLSTIVGGTSEANKLDFIIRRVMSGMATAALVKVEAVNSEGGLAPVGTVDVKMLVNQIDGIGNNVEHGVIYGVPYFRLNGGTNAVIIDPKVGDIGLCVFASRDISSAKVNKAPSPPGSRRKFSYADGLYFGGFLSETPENYIMFDDAGDVTIKPATKLTVIGDVEVQGNIDLQGGMEATGDVVADSISLKEHVHGGVTAGSAKTAVPE